MGFEAVSFPQKYREQTLYYMTSQQWAVNLTVWKKVASW
jgi:hypothetical protein